MCVYVYVTCGWGFWVTVAGHLPHRFLHGAQQCLLPHTLARTWCRHTSISARRLGWDSTSLLSCLHFPSTRAAEHLFLRGVEMGFSCEHLVLTLCLFSISLVYCLYYREFPHSLWLT